MAKQRLQTLSVSQLFRITRCGKTVQDYEVPGAFLGKNKAFSAPTCVYCGKTEVANPDSQSVVQDYEVPQNRGCKPRITRCSTCVCCGKTEVANPDSQSVVHQDAFSVGAMQWAENLTFANLIRINEKVGCLTRGMPAEVGG